MSLLSDVHGEAATNRLCTLITNIYQAYPLPYQISSWVSRDLGPVRVSSHPIGAQLQASVSLHASEPNFFAIFTRVLFLTREFSRTASQQLPPLYYRQWLHLPRRRLHTSSSSSSSTSIPFTKTSATQIGGRTSAGTRTSRQSLGTHHEEKHPPSPPPKT